MHTMRYPTRLWLLPFALIGAGCSSTGGFGRSAEDSKIRTIASIGDRPISSTTGTPESSAVANLETPERRRDGRDLVSGRVIDDKGEPAANARVRIADGGLAGGRVVQAKTDRGGGFTLHGLRPGSTYTLIAEFQGPDGLVEGRTEVRTPQVDVEIALQTDDQPLDRRRAGRTPSTRNVSDRQSVDEDRPLRLNEEDTPRSGEVEDVDDIAGKTSMRSRAGAIPVSGWRRIDGKTELNSSAVASSAVGDRSTRQASTRVSAGSDDDPAPQSRSSREADPPPAVDDDEGENPLPPAIEPDRNESARRPKPPRRISQSKSNGPGQVPGALVLAKEEPPPARTGRDPEPPPAEEAPLADPFTPIAPKQSPRFGDLADAWKSLPLSESATAPAARVSRAKTPTGLDASKSVIEACRYDSRRRQIIDFRLPDLDGRAVSLKDLDGDLILLDFWGTWCRPCLDSVPHLVGLQERLGGKRLTIVGIACEEGRASANAARVAEVADTLGINYTILLSSKDERSPLLEALSIQAFPTMIVIDRQGRIVWRDQGATEATLARLDRAVDPAVRAGTVDRLRR